MEIQQRASMPMTSHNPDRRRKPAWLSRAITVCGTVAIGLAVANPASAQIPCSYTVQILPDVNCGLWHSPLPAAAMSNTGIVIGEFGACGQGGDSAWWNGGPSLPILPRPPRVAQ